MKLPEVREKITLWSKQLKYLWTELTIKSVGGFFQLLPARKNNIEFCISSQILYSHKHPHHTKPSVNHLSTQAELGKHLHFSHWEAVAEFCSSTGSEYFLTSSLNVFLFRASVYTIGQAYNWNSPKHSLIFIFQTGNNQVLSGFAFLTRTAKLSISPLLKGTLFPISHHFHSSDLQDPAPSFP